MTKADIQELYKMMFTEFPDIVSIPDLCKMLDVSERYAYKLVNDGYIQGRKIGHAFKIPKVNVINYVLSIDQQIDLNSN